MVYPESKPPFASDPIVRGPGDLDRLPRPDPTAAGSRMADRVAGLDRKNVAVIDEPLYGHYLRVTGAEHPGREDVIAAMNCDEILERLDERRLDGHRVGYGKLKVTVRIRGYQKKRLLEIGIASCRERV